jgi:two-component system sensor histidine kinase HydH
VITQLLEFARPMSLEKKATSLQALVRHSLKMVEADAKRKGISIRIDLPELSKEVWIDPDKMEQVLLNLYLNAIESMETQGTLTVELRQHPESPSAEIVVSDTGAGIKDEDLVHVFDPYFTTKASGSGLGLAIVHKIIESHNGEVKIQSRYGGGTSVSVFLPPLTEV